MRQVLGSRGARWTESLDRVWQDFSRLGFGIPGIVADAIEHSRVRGNGEEHVGIYIREVIKESCYLPGGRWSPKIRKALADPYRSAYLDRLQAAADSGAFGFLGNDANKLQAILDPSLIVYTSLKSKDGSAWKSHLEEIRSEKDREIERLETRLATVSTAEKSLEPNNVVALLAAIAQNLGLGCDVINKGRNARVVLHVPIGDGYSLFIEWDDFTLLDKWGDLHLMFLIQDSDQAVWARGDYQSVPFAIGLGGLIPGGEWYSRTGRNWNALALSLLAHGEFARLVANHAQLLAL